MVRLETIHKLEGQEESDLVFCRAFQKVASVGRVRAYRHSTMREDPVTGAQNGWSKASSHKQVRIEGKFHLPAGPLAKADACLGLMMEQKRVLSILLDRADFERISQSSYSTESASCERVSNECHLRMPADRS